MKNQYARYVLSCKALLHTGTSGNRMGEGTVIFNKCFEYEEPIICELREMDREDAIYGLDRVNDCRVCGEGLRKSCDPRVEQDCSLVVLVGEGGGGVDSPSQARTGFKA